MIISCADGKMRKLGDWRASPDGEVDPGLPCGKAEHAGLGER